MLEKLLPRLPATIDKLNHESPRVEATVIDFRKPMKGEFFINDKNLIRMAAMNRTTSNSEDKWIVKLRVIDEKAG